MTTPVCVRQRIRQLDRQGLSHKEISRRLGVSRTTVVKYANPMGIIHPGHRMPSDRAGRWSTTGTRPSWTDGRPPTCACRSSNAIPRPACTSGSWRNAGSRARTRRCSAGSSVGGKSIERSRTASPNRSGRREARRSISARPGPWSRAWNGSCISWRCRSRTRTCAGWRHCRARPRNACARDCWRCSRGRA